MDYVPYEKNVNFLPKEKFDEFYKEVTEVLLDAMNKKNRNKDKNVSLQDLMDEYGIVIQNTDGVMKSIRPALTANLYEPTVAANKACGACLLCGVCAVCGPSAAAALVALSGIIALIEK